MFAKFLLAWCIALGLMPGAAWAQAGQNTSAPVASPALFQRAYELLPIINGVGDVRASFAPTFLADVPEAKLREIAQQLRAQLGKAVGVGAFTPTSATEGSLRMSFVKGTAKMVLAVEPGPHGQIIGLHITDVGNAGAADIASLDGVALAISALAGQSGPSQTGFIVADLAHPGSALAAVAPDQPLAVASSFKLVILAELVREVNAGTRGWGEKITLDGSELPAGGFNQLPAGAKIPLRKLAEEMIRISDNSATDILIRTLGRQNIEAMQDQLGWRHAAANRPFLTTLEAFKLKGVGAGALGQRYLAQDEAGRRAMLDGEVARTPASAIGGNLAGEGPKMIGALEWFASPADLVRVMGWLNAQQATHGGKEALRIMALNPGPGSAVTSQFAYVGYKGGSEPGVVSLTLLLRAKDGGAKVVSASWNNIQAPVNELTLVSLVSRAAEILAGTP